MRALLTCLLIFCAGPAQAMNWEGHDDWMAAISPAHDYRQAVPDARPVDRPPPACVQGMPDPAPNPYEQIPLGGPHCRAPLEDGEVQR